jgi:hypothetical protein
MSFQGQTKPTHYSQPHSLPLPKFDTDVTIGWK